MADTLVCFYRISDCFQNSMEGGLSRKQRPPWFDKQKCLLNFISVFGSKHLFLIADAVSESTKQWLLSLIPASQVEFTTYRSGAYSFLHAARMASNLPGSSKVLLSEDDYLWTSDCKSCLIEALDIADYATGYDANDKYVNGGLITPEGCVGNPLITGNSEQTRLFLTQSCHHKSTNSTTMTFCAKAQTIKEDLHLYNEFCYMGYPRDFQLFRCLIIHHRRTLISCVPAKATHCESAYLAPLVDWQEVLEGSVGK